MHRTPIGPTGAAMEKPMTSPRRRVASPISASGRRGRGGRDPDEDALAVAEPALDVATHPEGNEEPVLPPVRAEKRGLEVRPPVHPLRATLERRTVLPADGDRCAAGLADPP